jgi:hypothetical protein
MRNARFFGKLTKQFIFSLPEGLYLVSNVMEAPSQPLFAETVRPTKDRAAQWQAIVAARANHRHCHVFDHPADFLAFSLEIPYARERN